MRVLAAFLVVLSLSAHADDRVTVAVASNFRAALDDVVTAFTAATGYRVRVSTASTGKLYAQIVNGAPFDVLLAADAERPSRLEATGVGVGGTRTTYAIGSLVLWSRSPDIRDCRAALTDGGDLRIAIANPDTAPYGAAAREFLVNSGAWEAVRTRLVIGENIAQTLQFVASGNAPLGLVAASQLHSPSLPPASCSWPVPQHLHEPIRQQAILLRHGADNNAAGAFLGFLGSDTALAVIRAHGYELPE